MCHLANVTANRQIASIKKKTLPAQILTYYAVTTPREYARVVHNSRPVTTYYLGTVVEHQGIRREAHEFRMHQGKCSS
jgi:hypothetical protein